MLRATFRKYCNELCCHIDWPNPEIAVQSLVKSKQLEEVGLHMSSLSFLAAHVTWLKVRSQIQLKGLPQCAMTELQSSDHLLIIFW